MAEKGNVSWCVWHTSRIVANWRILHTNILLKGRPCQHITKPSSERKRTKRARGSPQMLARWAVCEGPEAFSLIHNMARFILGLECKLEGLLQYLFVSLLQETPPYWAPFHVHWAPFQWPPFAIRTLMGPKKLFLSLIQMSMMQQH